jgi:hypothetical protein
VRQFTSICRDLFWLTLRPNGRVSQGQYFDKMTRTLKNPVLAVSCRYGETEDLDTAVDGDDNRERFLRVREKKRRI